MSASPTLTGTITAASISASANISASTGLFSGNVGIGTTSPGALLHIGSGYGVTSSMARLSVGYDTSRNPRGVLEWHDVSNTTGRIFTEYDGTMVSMVFGSLYNTAYNNNNLMIIRGNGRVGIGATAPDFNLVVGTPGSTTDATIQIGSSATTTGNLFFGDATGGGSNSFAGYIQYDHSGNSLRLGTNSTERVRVDSSGNVGIGNTTPGTDGGVTPRLAVATPANADKFVGIGYDNSGDYGFIHSIHRATAWKNLAIQAFGGNVGIGTTSPDATLQVVGTAFFGADGAYVGVGSPRVVFYNTANTETSTLWFQAGVGSSLAGFKPNDGTFYITNTYAGNALGTNGISISTGGNVGIGTASPDANLTVQGQASFNSGSLANPGIAARGDLNTGIYFPAADTIGFVEGGVEAMRLDASGRLGIGTTIPSRTLTVNGSTNITGSLDVTGAFTAQTKSFKIQHQVQTDKSLVYGVLEGPEHAVYARGRVSIGLTGTQTIYLPDEWEWLVDEDTITVQLTPIGSHQKLYVESTNSKYITIAIDGFFTKNINCYYLVHATRKDVAPLQTVQ
jgi:hypothetical protein